MTGSIRHHRKARRWLVSVIAASAALVSIFAVHAQDNQFQLFVTPVDASGMPVTDLKVEDLSFNESGMPGKVVTVERFNLPIRVTLFIDNGPDSERVLEHYRTGLTALADALPADMEAAFYTTAPAPRLMVKSMTDRGELKKAFARIGKDDEGARFTDSLVEYAQRLEKDAKEKKLTYLPALIMVSAIANDPTNYQRPELERAMGIIQRAGTRVMVATTTSKLNDATARQDLTIGRQGSVGSLLVKQTTGGDFQALPDPKSLTTVLPDWGKLLAASHAKQTNQIRVVLQRPAGASGAINPQNLDLRITRAGVKPAGVSGTGRF